MADTLVITGPVGAGKTTVASAIATLLEARDIPHALVDMDALRDVYPAPEGDPFATQIGYRNLAAMWPNLRAVHPRVLILADVVETRGQLAEYEVALPGTRITIVRLDVPMPLILARLDTRERPGTLAWYRRRAPELQEVMEREQVADLVIDAGDRSPDAIAREIVDRTLRRLSE